MTKTILVSLTSMFLMALNGTYTALETNFEQSQSSYSYSQVNSSQTSSVSSSAESSGTQNTVSSISVSCDGGGS